MTREKIEKMFPGTPLSEEMITMLLAQKPMNQIPAEYQTYDTFESADVIVKNGFKLSGKNIALDLVKNDQDRIDVRFSYQKVTRSTSESRSGTLPLGPIQTVECETMNEK